MTTLHVFGCSITQGFALPDTINPILDDQGQPLADDLVQRMLERGQVRWEDIHLYKPSQYAWPQVLGDLLGLSVTNHARRGACFQQIARQCAVNRSTIQAEDTVIVMWTYVSRLSFQWPARTAVPFCNIVDPFFGWQTRILPGFNEFFGLSKSDPTTRDRDQRIHDYIQRSSKTHLDPMGVYNHYYNNLVLQVTVDGLLRSTGARVIHLSVEPEPLLAQLDQAQRELEPSLREPWAIPDPRSWYDLKVDHQSCLVIHDPRIPPAENDMHPSVTHHRNFAEHILKKYFNHD